MTDTKLPGRPKEIDGDGSRVSAWVPLDVQQRIADSAAGKSSMSAAIRRALEMAFPLKK